MIGINRYSFPLPFKQGVLHLTGPTQKLLKMARSLLCFHFYSLGLCHLQHLELVGQGQLNETPCTMQYDIWSLSLKIIGFEQCCCFLTNIEHLQIAKAKACHIFLHIYTTVLLYTK